jgi:hypothetical protein
MTKKIYRRSLKAAIMVLMAISLSYTSPSARAQSPTQGSDPTCYYCYCDGGRCYCVPVACP